MKVYNIFLNLEIHGIKFFFDIYEEGLDRVRNTGQKYKFNFW